MRADGFSKGDMRDASGIEEAFLPCDRPIDKLIHEYEGARSEFLPEGTACGEGDEIRNSHSFERVYVGAVVDAAWRNAMTAPVAGKEDNIQPLELTK
jgi:hypothetical protein